MSRCLATTLCHSPIALVKTSSCILKCWEMSKLRASRLTKQVYRHWIGPVWLLIGWDLCPILCETSSRCSIFTLLRSSLYHVFLLFAQNPVSLHIFAGMESQRLFFRKYLNPKVWKSFWHFRCFNKPHSTLLFVAFGTESVVMPGFILQTRVCGFVRIHSEPFWCFSLL